MMVNEVMLAFHGAATGIAITDLQHRFIYANPAYCEMLGYSELELMSLTSRDVTHPDDRSEKMIEIGNVLQGRLKSVVTQKRYQAKDGRVVWGRLSVSAQRDNEGHIIGLIGVVEDVTELEALQLRQLDAERSLDRLLSNLPGMVYRCRNDASWTMLYLSQAAHKLTGFPVDHLIGNKVRSYASLIHPDDQQRVTAQVQRSLQSLQPFQLEYRIQHADGGWRWVWEQGSPVNDVGSGQYYLEGYIFDITAQKAAEEELARVRRLESLGQLTGGVAHDFNNLLTVILGNAELLEHSAEPQSEQALLAGMISSAAQRGAGLTRALLAFARRQPLHPQPTGIAAMLQDTQRLLERVIGESIRFELLVEQSLPAALVDRAQLESALLNLAINARDAMTQGGSLRVQADSVNVTETTEGAEALLAGRYVRITVSDTGEGIAPKNLARVFEPFFTTKARGKGTGLGLAMVHGFVHQSGGQITIDSKVGQGTTVSLLLPCAPEELTAAQTPPVQDQTQIVHQPSQAAILVVEDDAPVRDYACSVLTQNGYTVHQAVNGDEAFDLLRAGLQVDILFTDVVMPGGMNGPMLAQKARDLWPGLRVLLTSGYPEHELQEGRGWNLGEQLLPKPYRQADLLASLQKLLA